LKTNAFYAALGALGLVFFSSQALALSVNLGVAGPADWTVLDVGTGTVSISGGGSITGNVGLDGGNLSDSGAPITGNLVTSGTGNVSLSGGATISGTTTQNSTSVSQAASAAVAASSAAAAQLSSGGGVGITSIIYNNAGTIDLTAGVYNLTSLVLNDTTLDLTAGASYVFNISGSLALSASEILDQTGADVVFNIIQGAASLSGGSVLDGIVLAPDATFSDSGSSVVGEIIAANISISGAKVQGDPVSVPDSGSSLLLLGMGIGCLCVCGKFGHYRRCLRLSTGSSRLDRQTTVSTRQLS
jgi:choice-of-anchor A domain-containing protein